MENVVKTTKISSGYLPNGVGPNGEGSNTLLTTGQESSGTKGNLQRLIDVLTPITGYGSGNSKQLEGIGQEAKLLLDQLMTDDKFVSSLRQTGFLKPLQGFVNGLTTPMLFNDLDNGTVHQNNKDQDNRKSSAQNVVRQLKAFQEMMKQRAETQVSQAPQANPQETRWASSNDFIVTAAEGDGEESKPKKKSQPKTSYERKSKEEEDESKGKKSNPFRVLMGIVGKLLDKGWDSAEIVRHIKKETHFDPKTIKKCVKIVKDYNRKEKRDLDELETIDKASDRLRSEALPIDLLRGFAMRQDIRKVFASTAFENASESWERQGIYSVKDDFSKRSTRELVDRMYYLTACQKYDPFSDNGTRNNGPKGSLSSIGGELKQIKTALKDRGWAEDDLDAACEIIKSNDHHPFKVTNRE